MTWTVTWSMSNEAGAVCDSSPLIWLAKVNRLSLVKHLFSTITIPEKVRLEVSFGGFADSLLILEALEEGWIKASGEVYDEADALVKVSGLHPGEADAIFLARKLGAMFVVDEREASATARGFGGRSMGRLGVLLSGLAERHLCLDEFVGGLALLMACGCLVT